MRILWIFLLIFSVLMSGSQASFASVYNFKIWLKTFKAEARSSGIPDHILQETLPETLAPIERVIALDRKQPEKTKTFDEYLANVVNKKRIEQARILYRENKRLLTEIEARYGVDPQYIVALWGIETNFGQNTGGYDVIHALATLAYEGRRADFFRDELLKALRIVSNGDVRLADMKGSWAGAMGQCQFMPSSFFNFAEDYDRDGKRDIWKTKADVFASAANYLSKSGWKHGEPWGRAVRLPSSFEPSLVGLDQKHSLQFWHDKGIRLQNGKSLPFEGAYQASLIQPGGAGTAAYIVYDNYRVIMKWNRSTYFATAVGFLADKTKG